LGILFGVAWVAAPSHARAGDTVRAPATIVKVIHTDDDPDEGVPGGSVRIIAPGSIDNSPALPATGPEQQAAAAEGPTVEIPDVAPLAPTDSITPELKPDLIKLRNKVRKALAIFYDKHLNTRDNSPWEVMHGIIAYGVDAKMFRGAARGEEVNAIGWMCFNGACRGEQLFYLNDGEIVARQGPGLQGHYGQFLAIIAQCHVKPNYPINVGGRMFSIDSLIEHEKMGCQAGEELTFKLIGLMHYLDSDATWRNREGQSWSIQRLVHEELGQPIRGAACGGTHRLMGLSYAVNKRRQRGQPIDGEFRRAQTYVNDFHRYTFSLQNPDGSFSTEWFARRGANPDIDRRLKTTGHVTEWLSYSLADTDLLDPRMVKAVDYLAGVLVSGKDHTWEIGPLGHGLHALRIYDRRVFRPLDPPSATAAWLDPANANEDAPVISTAKAKPDAKSF
jgi:hypothetical protein